MDELRTIAVTKVSGNRYCLSMNWTGKRYRFYNAKAIGIENAPNQELPKARLAAFNLLKRQYLEAIKRGWTPNEDWSKLLVEKTQPTSLLRIALKEKLRAGYSYHYERKLTWLVDNLEKYIKRQPITAKLVAEYLNDPKRSPAMRNNLRRHFIALEPELRKYGYEGSIATLVKRSRVVEQLHKPVRDLNRLLSEVKLFDYNLYICCLMAYGCLLRPHREIRLLTWGDFSDSLDLVALSGSRTKGKRNRVIPVNDVIRQELSALRGDEWTPTHNIFSKNEKPFALGYFSVLWTRFKAVSEVLEPDQTLYSLRHTGAIRVYDKTGSLTKLQQVMGHSSLQVSLTYLRGLEVRQIEQKNMPDFRKF